MAPARCLDRVSRSSWATRSVITCRTTGSQEVAVYEVPTTIDLEQVASKRTTVYRVAAVSRDS